MTRVSILYVLHGTEREVMHTSEFLRELSCHGWELSRTTMTVYVITLRARILEAMIPRLLLTREARLELSHSVLTGIAPTRW
jgi:hypothetical protein